MCASTRFYGADTGGARGGWSTPIRKQPDRGLWYPTGTVVAPESRPVAHCPCQSRQLGAVPDERRAKPALALVAQRDRLDYLDIWPKAKQPPAKPVGKLHRCLDMGHRITETGQLPVCAQRRLFQMLGGPGGHPDLKPDIVPSLTGPETARTNVLPKVEAGGCLNEAEVRFRIVERYALSSKAIESALTVTSRPFLERSRAEKDDQPR